MSKTPGQRARLKALEQITAPEEDGFSFLLQEPCDCRSCRRAEGRQWTCERTGATVFTLRFDTGRINDLEAA